jgi:hypothetical protein
MKRWGVGLVVAGLVGCGAFEGAQTAEQADTNATLDASSTSTTSAGQCDGTVQTDWVKVSFRVYSTRDLLAKAPVQPLSVTSEVYQTTCQCYESCQGNAPYQWGYCNTNPFCVGPNDPQCYFSSPPPTYMGPPDPNVQTVQYTMNFNTALANLGGMTCAQWCQQTAQTASPSPCSGGANSVPTTRSFGGEQIIQGSCCYPNAADASADASTTSTSADTSTSTPTL